MKFLNEYRKIRNNYRVLNWINRFIIWMRFKITPLDRLIKLIPTQGRLLDLGCGFGVFSYFFAQRFPKLQIIGLDPSVNRIELANNVFEQPENLEFYQGEINNLKEENFKAVLLNDVIYLFSKEELIEVFKKCHQKTSLDGVLVIKTMNRARFFRYLFSISTPWLINKIISVFSTKKGLSRVFGFRKSNPVYYHPEAIENVLKQTGWTNIQVYDLPAIIFPYPHIIYFCQKK